MMMVPSSNVPSLEKNDTNNKDHNNGNDSVQVMMKQVLSAVHQKLLSTDSNNIRRRNKHHADTIYKLRRMIKAGIPRGAVEQQAHLAGIDPVEVFLGDHRRRRRRGTFAQDPTSCQKKQQKKNNAARAANDAAYVKRLRTMIQCGVPLAAVEQKVYVDRLERAKTTGDHQEILPLVEEEEEEEAPPALFSLVGETTVAFLSPSRGSDITEEKHDHQNQKKPGIDLVTLVAKILRTKCPSGDETLVVELKSLFNALNTFRGIQYAREQFNRTLQNNNDGKNECPPGEIQLRRRPLLELLGHLGIRQPLLLFPEDQQDSFVEIPGLDELVKLLECHFADTLQKMHHNWKEHGQYTFASLSELFQPGTRVLAKNAVTSGIDMMCQVAWSKYEQGKTLFGNKCTFSVCFQFVVAVGGGGGGGGKRSDKKFTLCDFVERMDSFEGNRFLKDLPFVPLSSSIHNNLELVGSSAHVDEIRDSFRRRGEYYSQWSTGSHFLQYNQGSFYAKSGNSKSQGSSSPVVMRGRVMVDTQGSYEAGHSLTVGYDPMVLSIQYKMKEYMQYKRQQLKHQQGASSTAGHHLVDCTDGMILLEQLPTDLLELTWPAVVGFSFTCKAWGDVLVDGLSEIQFRESTFDKLVLPPTQKRMIKALVRHSKGSFTDIVSGKGEGSVFLLYGPPGVGKTLTAEAISEMLHRPLYCVSLGQIGTTPAELEAKLGEILDLCSRWDALVLLDEADIFLEKRSSTGSLERNAMVSVMLRLVEYFKGVLFLTSNRVDSLDPAFKTRITIALSYEALDLKARNQIWVNLLEASGHGQLVESEEIDTWKLAETELNGREIKNAIRLSLALAAEDGAALSHDIIDETVSLLCEFNQKMDNADKY